MTQPYVIVAFREKRAELSGEIQQAEKRIAALRADLEAIDGAIRVFDPSMVPHATRPKVKRQVPYQLKDGHLRRALLDVLRWAEAR